MSVQLIICMAGKYNCLSNKIRERKVNDGFKPQPLSYGIVLSLLTVISEYVLNVAHN